MTVTVPVSVMSPLLAVTVRSPRTKEVARATPVVLVTVAWPAVPLVVSANVPVTAWLTRLMIALFAEAT